MKIKRSNFFALVLLLPSWAVAYGGSSLMFNIEERRYSQNAQSHYTLLYRLKAQKRTFHQHKKSLSFSLNKQSAKRILFYDNGSLELNQSQVNFSVGFFYRGIFYMQLAQGYINGQPFSAKEIAFDPQKKRISATHIVFSSNSKINIRANFATDIKH